ncbi:uncharacterized protein BO96DRAFT_468800 [Aspergillus niger CBS 101883]|uniref:uncharacterized protein n=1 Tax=Aspergillus lacticoffeatus (strain CBS 101883) TaxID=1450533 RepID=UPI000D803A6C|nr:uncharacterized protein BO96DRAFT_468800 [Aspergillus niger CBS 101883]PYH53096.1 hypothetical protein BO96DRAFT_468800 [Aspergillus niger CBS 101883]
MFVRLLSIIIIVILLLPVLTKPNYCQQYWALQTQTPVCPYNSPSSPHSLILHLGGPALTRSSGNSKEEKEEQKRKRMMYLNKLKTIRQWIEGFIVIFGFNIRVESNYKEYHSSRVINLEKEEGRQEGRRRGLPACQSAHLHALNPISTDGLVRRNKPLEMDT